MINANIWRFILKLISLNTIFGDNIVVNHKMENPEEKKSMENTEFK